ncbi:MAG TPA: hypothetical protein VFC78_14455 [Tepidisphaeraceae bacterium]|nr:hypothetical protein [Tepidisphaeraceae bacterium]
MLQALLENWYFPPASMAAFAGVLGRGRFFAGRRSADGAMSQLRRQWRVGYQEAWLKRPNGEKSGP